MSIQDTAMLKKQRGLIKASCTRIKTYADSVTQPSASVIAQLEERKIKLEGYWSEYNVVQTKLELADDAEVNDRASFEEAFYSLAAKLRQLTTFAPPIHSSGAIPPSPSAFRSAPETYSHVRLPKLNLPNFSGKYDEWFPFRDVFNSVIHSNSTLSNAQKLQYLRSSVTGEASNIICSLEISDANYEAAWSRLKERYDNERVVVQNHVRAIMELPSLNKENCVELRQIADGATKHLHALQALKRPCDKWDDILIVVLTSKLDPRTAREWQSSLTGSELPVLKQFFDFLNHHCQALEASTKVNIQITKGAAKISLSDSKRQLSCPATVKAKCNYCKGEHSIYYCKDFLALSVPQRNAEVLTRKFCTNCLRSVSHSAVKCPSGNCRICQVKHNTLLHPTTANRADSSPSNVGADGAKCAAETQVTSTLASSHSGGGEVILSTAIILTFDSRGNPRPCRALLDCGSQANFISSQFLETLGLKSRPISVTINGVNGSATKSTQIANLRLQSRINSYTAVVDCIVTDLVTEPLPVTSFKREALKLPRNISLADPKFNVSSAIDVLIGAELFWELLCVGQIDSSVNHPRLQKTRLGWILAGRLSGPTSPMKVQSNHMVITNEQLHEQISRLWRLDDLFTTPHSPEERFCERHFTENVSQNAQGRYTVKLPIKENLLHKLGESKEIALRRFKSLEKRLSRDPSLKVQYHNFIKEYLALGHMLLSPSPDKNATAFYLPHHCVFKVSKGTPKLRVVFDASCKSDSGVSLNDVMGVGPVVQQELISILMRFRYFYYVLSADIVKMYRQILIDPEQTSLQRILWRDSPNERVDTYELLTITYGTSAASFLATRCLIHIAERYSSKFPVGSRCIKRDFYVDDLLTGADSVPELESIRDQVIQVLQAGSFELGKWASNRPQILEFLQNHEDEIVTLSNDESSVLGIRWNQSRDTLLFSCGLDRTCRAVSKRVISSEISRCFDPLGLLGPVIVIGKLILQELWQSGVQWDEAVPQNLHTRWLKLRSQLFDLDQLQIPRGVRLKSKFQSIQLHGFCDASQNAYGACVYVRTQADSNKYSVELLCSRSRVAPLKTVSLPRLELSAALLLARLMFKVVESLDIPYATKFLWSDSTITLNWITSPSRKWSTFVANRVGEIQGLTEIKEWRHVDTSNNPADILSRGLEPRVLAISTMWWHGPQFLQLNENNWSPGAFDQIKDDIPEQRKVAITTVTEVKDSLVNDLLSKFSNLNKVCRITAYCLRFSKARRAASPCKFISPEESSHALRIMCKDVQRQTFSREREALRKGEAISNSSRLLSLSPFIDKHDLIRVGGRLRNSQMPEDSCHPILLPRDHTLTRLVIEREHVRNLHAGSQATMAAVRQTFWPLSLRSSTRKIIQKCITCFKANPRQSEAVMGSIPASRVTMARPFSRCGVDYAGPIILREGKRRNAKNHKAYIAIFVCFVTKAVHIELVSDLTTDAFLSALRRFISRRGKPSHIFSDNGTTFVGAHGQLRELYEFYNQSLTQDQITQYLSNQEISWSFIPPNAPHFGGLWEAVVKSAKLHMVRIIGKAHLTFEELQTLLCEIEAILNSRPLTALSSDPNDMAHLTPGHFLIGTALNTFPSRDITDVPENRLVRWERIEQIRQHFWHRWSTEYLQSLQERSKWKDSKGTQLQPNQLVLVRQPKLSPLQWILGRVRETHPGSDGVARTATIQTARGSLTRPLTKLAILPLEA